MDVHQLELFLAVMESASITRAAERMNLSPGAVSLQMQHLAAELRTDLFTRAGKRIQATPAAVRLADHARNVVRQMRQIRQEFENDPACDTRPFHFAAGATTLIHCLGRPLRLLRKEYPHTPIEVTVAPTEEMVAGLLDRRFDLALISLPYNEDNLTIVPLYEEELLILRPSPAQVRKWHVGAVALTELASAQFLLYPQHSNMRAIIQGFFRELGLAPRVIMEADDTEAIKRLVESGFGYSILPEFALHKAPRYFQVFRVAGKRLARRQALAMARSEYPRALTVSIAEFLRDQLVTHNQARAIPAGGV